MKTSNTQIEVFEPTIPDGKTPKFRKLAVVILMESVDRDPTTPLHGKPVYGKRLVTVPVSFSATGQPYQRGSDEFDRAEMPFNEQTQTSGFYWDDSEGNDFSHLQYIP